MEVGSVEGWEVLSSENADFHTGFSGWVETGN
jgi:hypothetical protein